MVHCHPNARRTPAGRAEVFEAVEAGLTVVAACLAFRVSRRWYYRWLPRWHATRLVYAELLPDERRYTTAHFAVRAVRWFRSQSIAVERVLTDNGSAYRSRVFGRMARRLASPTSAPAPTGRRRMARLSVGSEPC